MAQTEYLATMRTAYPGMKGTARDTVVQSYASAEASAEIPFGVGVIQGATAAKAVLPSAVTDAAKFLGVVLHSHTYQVGVQLGDVGVKPKRMLSVQEVGDPYVTVEEAVNRGDQVYMRITSDGGSNTQPGTFRKTPDGVAEVQTITPTAANAGEYVLQVVFPQRNNLSYIFHATGDADATATEICNSWRVAMAANAAFTALVVATGTATLILTGQLAGETFKVYDSSDPAVSAVVVTTAGAPKAIKLPGVFFEETLSAAGVGRISLNRNATKAITG